eukprot:TRINITY_DN5651_c0_g2_i1.p1 TRINITY_DN5651_c0_g2~~TRINITY_DN5651_c0_g2_i1.p1  ORF type:complete len:882 (-),score=278.21 TRINITY_DN5651_c0_g2_i1:670-3258(-)
MYSTDSGVWFVENEGEKVTFLEISGGVESISLPRSHEFCKGENTGGVSFLMQHPITHELVVLLSTGAVVVCSHIKKQGEIVVSQLFYLNGCPQEDIVGMDLMHLFLIIYLKDTAKIYELGSGILVGTADLPVQHSSLFIDSYEKHLGLHLWKHMTPPGDNPVGIWGSNGVWHLRCRKITEIASHLQLLSPSNVKHSARLCKVWGLERWFAKFQIDLIAEYTHILLSEKEGKILASSRSLPLGTPVTGTKITKEDLVEACEGLMPYLQNPGLVMAFLSNVNSLSNFVSNEVNKFLDLIRCDINGGSGGSSGGAGSTQQSEELEIEVTETLKKKKKTSLQYYTSLNIQIKSIMESYAEITKSHHHGAPSNKPYYNMQAHISSLTPQEVLKLSHAKLINFVYSCPGLMLLKIQEAVGITTSMLRHMKAMKPNQKATCLPTSLNPCLFYPEEILENVLDPTVIANSSIIPYFEILVQLYYDHQPEFVVPFVDLVQHSSPPFFISSHSMHHRALDCLPPLAFTSDLGLTYHLKGKNVATSYNLPFQDNPRGTETRQQGCPFEKLQFHVHVSLLVCVGEKFRALKLLLLLACDLDRKMLERNQKKPVLHGHHRHHQFLDGDKQSNGGGSGGGGNGGGGGCNGGNGGGGGGGSGGDERGQSIQNDAEATGIGTTSVATAATATTDWENEYWLEALDLVRTGQEEGNECELFYSLMRFCLSSPYHNSDKNLVTKRFSELFSVIPQNISIFDIIMILKLRFEDDPMGMTTTTTTMTTPMKVTVSELRSNSSLTTTTTTTTSISSNPHSVSESSQGKDVGVGDNEEDDPSLGILCKKGDLPLSCLKQQLLKMLKSGGDGEGGGGRTANISYI